ncbi:MAG: PAS domain S-box protein, partial [bacterium]
DVNQKVLDRFGYHRSEILALKTADLHPTSALESSREAFEKVLQDGYVKFEIEFKKKNGQVFPGEFSASLFEIAGSKIVQGIVHDITDRKQSVEDLRKLSRAVEQSKSIVMITDVDGNIEYVNPSFTRATGYTFEEVLGKNPRILKSGEISSEEYKHLWDTITSGREWRGEFHNKKKSGELYWESASISPIKNDAGTITHFLAIKEDITDRRRAEVALKDSEEKFRSLAEQSPNMIFINKKGRIVYANKMCEEIMGYTRAEFYSPDFNFLTLIAPESIDLVKKNFSLHLRDQEVTPYEYTLITKEGNRVEGIHTTKLLNYEGENAILGIITDITERKRAEEALKKSEEKYRTLFEESKDAVFFSTPGGKFIDINTAGIELFGYASKEEILQIDIAHDLYGNPQEREVIKQILAEKGFIKDYELVMKRKDGKKLNVLETITVVRDEQGKIVSYQGIIHDLTEHKHLEEQLLHAQKMETIGTLVGGVAHDFNNLLTVILGNTEFGLQDLKSDDPVKHDLIRIENAATQARDLISQLLSFSRQQVLNPRVLDLNKNLEDLLKMLKRIIGENIELWTELDASLAPVWADPIQIQQVLMNLCVNARDAMPQGGQLILKTHNVNGDNIKAPIIDKSRNYVQLTLTDTGEGMDSKIQARIFEPFFTTKEVGRGTGLGLSVVYGIVKQHKGHIEVSSKKGTGTTFNIYLQAIDGSKYTNPKMHKKSRIRRGHETILLVDDEEAVRRVTARILQSLGYTVLSARNGQEAIEIFEKQHKKIKLVILDMILPQSNGPEIYAKMRSIQHNLSVLFITGYNFHNRLDDFELLEQRNISMLQKPYTKEILSMSLRELLDV